ncbi:MAG: response regulator [Bacteroidia bacterium]|jgi:CheY-like chemotaxis protein
MLRSKNIYLAEDDIDDVDFFKEALKDICPGCTLHVSGNGEELIEALDKGNPKPDIIFIDINMPKMDGIEALISMKSNGYLSNNIPVIIYSTSTNYDSIKRAYDNGANHYFTKPSSFGTLADKIKTFLSINWAGYIMPVGA